jgi:hypothetical protein
LRTRPGLPAAPHSKQHKHTGLSRRSPNANSPQNQELLSRFFLFDEVIARCSSNDFFDKLAATFEDRISDAASVQADGA